MSSARYRFGSFEFDVAQQVLRREGTALRLQAQPARVLAALLENCDRVVSRDELRQVIWGSGTYVKFDDGLNFCIAQIRSTLGDNSSSSLYIRTLPKLGYQFIAPVETLAESDPSSALAEQSKASDRRPMGLVALAMAVLCLVAFVAGYELRSPKKASRAPIIAVAGFDNETGNSDLNRFTENLTDQVVERLTSASGGRYTVIGNAKILRLPREQRDLKAVATSLNAKYVVLGQVLGNGEQALILAHLIRLPEQTHIWVTRISEPLASSEPAAMPIAQKIADGFSPRVSADILNGSSSPGLGR